MGDRKGKTSQSEVMTWAAEWPSPKVKLKGLCSADGVTGIFEDKETEAR